MVGGLKIAIALLLMLLMMVAAAVEFRGRGETLNDHPHKKACFAPLNDRTEQKGGSRRAALAAILSGSEPHHGAQRARVDKLDLRDLRIPHMNIRKK
ncbi:hypothetical protein GUITHDRAFT_152059, partial [Guillardia theta CCMP2712]|mmetsp:Transcript_52627/g.163301  ORF Transcript_52627/g.163301 Transcript_52627/m.163301 type:complete len:97 (-) Transcript_52627:507-797(-)